MSKFAEYVTSAAFRLDLSKRMCTALAYCYVNHHGEVRTWQDYCYVFPLRCPHLYIMPTSHTSTLHALRRRGLVRWLRDHTGEAYHLECTEEGVMVLDLVVKAGVLDEAYADAIAAKHKWMTETEDKRQELLAKQVLKGAPDGEAGTTADGSGAECQTLRSARSREVDVVGLRRA